MNISFPHKEYFSKKKNDLWFIVIGIILMVLLVWAFISSISFLSVSVDNALDDRNQNNPPVSFDLDALEGLGIVQKSSASVPATSSSTGAQ